MTPKYDLSELLSLSAEKPRQLVAQLRENLRGFENWRLTALLESVRQKIGERRIGVMHDNELGSQMSEEDRALLLIGAVAAECISAANLRAKIYDKAKEFTFLATDYFARAGMGAFSRAAPFAHTMRVVEHGISLIELGNELEGKGVLAGAVLAGYDMKLSKNQLTALVGIVERPIGGRSQINVFMHAQRPFDRPMVYTGPDRDFAPLSRP